MPHKDRKQRTEKGDGKGIRDTCYRYPCAVVGWLMVGCALGAVGVMNFIPRFKGPGHEVIRYDEPAGSTVFSGVRIPPETVPVSLGRTIGSLSESQPLDAQVGSESKWLFQIPLYIGTQTCRNQFARRKYQVRVYDEIESKGGLFVKRVRQRFGPACRAPRVTLWLYRGTV